MCRFSMPTLLAAQLVSKTPRRRAVGGAAKLRGPEKSSCSLLWQHLQHDTQPFLTTCLRQREYLYTVSTRRTRYNVNQKRPCSAFPSQSVTENPGTLSPQAPQLPSPPKSSELMQPSVASDTVGPTNPSAPPKPNATQLTLRKGQVTLVVEHLRTAIMEQHTAAGDTTTIKPYMRHSHNEGDDSKVDIDKELGPCVTDWEVAKYHKTNRDMPGQKIYKAESEDIAILSRSKWKYFSPAQSFEGLTYRIIRLTDAISSPVFHVKTNARAGVRREGRSRILVVGAVLAIACSSLGVWQLHRIGWKRDLIQRRRNRVTAPIEIVNASPLPWVSDMESWEYRQVQLRGVLDCRHPILVGPRDCTNKPENKGFEAGFLIFYTLRLEDGTSLLVNVGHISLKDLDRPGQTEIPQWVTIRGIVHPGEQPGILRFIGRKICEPVVNIPKNYGKVFSFIEPAKMAEAADLVDLGSASMAVIDAFDIWYDEDNGKLPGERPERNPLLTLTKRTDFFQFWCSEHTHFNYAVQWFIFAAFALITTFVKWIDVHHWKF